MVREAHKEKERQVIDDMQRGVSARVSDIFRREAAGTQTLAFFATTPSRSSSSPSKYASKSLKGCFCIVSQAREYMTSDEEEDDD
jgi:hypothetical protein